MQLYDPSQGHFIPNTHHINSSSVANVCDTDVFSIELIIKEIGAQIVHQLKKGSNLRLLFKIGKLITTAGKLDWRSMNEDHNRNRDNMSQTTSQFTSASKQMVGS